METSISPEDVKVAENRVRRAAERRGLRVRKSPRRDRGALDYGTYRVERVTGEPVACGQNGTTDYGLFLSDVVEIVAGYTPPKAPRVPQVGELVAVTLVGKITSGDDGSVLVEILPSWYPPDGQGDPLALYVSRDLVRPAP